MITELPLCILMNQHFLHNKTLYSIPDLLHLLTDLFHLKERRLFHVNYFMTLTWYTEACLSSAETNGVNDDLDRPFPAESRESNAFIYSASAILLLQTRTIFQKSPLGFVREGTVVLSVSETTS